MENVTGNIKLINWLTRSVSVNSLKPFEKNPRKITPEDFENLKRSLQEDGYHQRILCTPDLRVIGGHQRIKALKELGYTDIDVLIADRELPDSQFKRILVRDNLAYGQWDFEALGELMPLDELDDLGMDDAALQKTAKAHQEGLTDPDEVPIVPELPVSSLGDIWLLGTHRLMCGDSTDADNVTALLAGVQPMLMVTDPPYGVNYDPEWRNHAYRSDGTPIGASAKGTVSNDHKADWSEAWALFLGDVAYVWHAGNMAHIVAESLIKCGFDIRSQIIWNKNNMVIGRGDYHPKHEPCWYAVRKGKSGHYNGDRKQTTVWDIVKNQKSETGHSTQKPVECMKRPIENNSLPGEYVYEPFSGSGTTVIAGEMLQRKVLAMELAPQYVDMAIIRWQNFTGKQAVHAVTGLTFDASQKAQAA